MPWGPTVSGDETCSSVLIMASIFVTFGHVEFEKYSLKAITYSEL